MAIIHTLKENADQLKFILEIYDGVISTVVNALKVEKAFFKDGASSPSFVESTLNGILTGTNDTLDTYIVALLDAFSADLDIWPPVVDKGLFTKPDYWLSGIAVDVDDEAGKSKLTRIQEGSANIFSVFNVSDIIKISNAEDSNHNGFHTVSATSSSILTFDSTMSGSDNSSDKTMIVTLYKR